MNWLTIINAVFSWLWLLAVLWLLWRLWRTGDQRTAHMVKMEKMLTDMMQANTDSSRIAAESARQAVEVIHNLIALQAKGGARDE